MTIFRYFTVYGPAGRPDMSLFRFAQWIYEERPLRLYGDGTQSRDFTYVDDIARGTILGLRPLGYEIINLGSDNPHDLLELIGLIEQQAGDKARIEQHPMHAADVMATWANVEKAERMLGWRPEVTSGGRRGQTVRVVPGEPRLGQDHRHSGLRSPCESSASPLSGTGARLRGPLPPSLSCACP